MNASVDLIKISSTQSCINFCKRCPLNNEINYEKKIQLIPNSQNIFIDGIKVVLSSRGFRLLCALINNINKPLSFSYLIEYGWPDCSVVKNNLTVTISEMRTALRFSSFELVNIRGVGYMLTDRQTVS
tara:strand:- start:9441 stop:9824 length:384 start_codon:yes stop_codon:yes gene_type:complete